MTSEPAGAPVYSIYKDDPDMAEIVEIFVEELDERVGTMRSAFESRDWERLQTVAHQLKGASGGYGFDSVGDAAAALEHTIKSHPDAIETIQHELDALAALCARVSA
ncbi:MAG: hypothetical protein Tsb0013_01750 [Phycisphaerales bacterium]